MSFAKSCCINFKFLEAEYPEDMFGFAEKWAKKYFEKKGYNVIESHAYPIWESTKELKNLVNFGEINESVNFWRKKDTEVVEGLNELKRRRKTKYKLCTKLNKLVGEEARRFFLEYKDKGYPDFFVFNDEEFFFVEVKSYRDTLRVEQIEWIAKAKEKGIKTFVYVILPKKVEKTTLFEDFARQQSKEI